MREAEWCIGQLCNTQAAHKVLIQSEQVLTADAAKQDPNGSESFITSGATLRHTALWTAFYTSQLVSKYTSRLVSKPSSHVSDHGRQVLFINHNAVCMIAHRPYML